MENDKGPHFVGLICDGNRRWGAAHFNTPKTELTHSELTESYREGGERVKEIVKEARTQGVRILACWGGSRDNLVKRTSLEIQVLYETYVHFLTELRDEWMDHCDYEDVRFVHMGNKRRLNEAAPRVVQLIDEIANHTRGRLGMVAAFCLDYAGREEEDRAVHEAFLHRSHGDSINEWRHHLDLPRQGVPLIDLDLTIRTGQDPSMQKHKNEFLHGYDHETRDEYTEVLIPDFSSTLFSELLGTFRNEPQNRGK